MARGGDWRTMLQKEPHAKRMVVKVEELLLRVDNNGEEGGLVMDVGLDNNIAPYRGEVGEEVLAIEVEWWMHNC